MIIFIICSSIPFSMQQEELMKSSFDANIGTLGSSPVNTPDIEEQLREIQKGIEELKNNTKDIIGMISDKEKKSVEEIASEKSQIDESNNEIEPSIENVETPAAPIAEPVTQVETPVESEKTLEDTSSVEEAPVIEETTAPVMEESDVNIPAVEETFSPVEEPVSIDEPKIEDNNDVISIDDILASADETKEEVTPIAYEEPIAEDTSAEKEKAIVEPEAQIEAPAKPIVESSPAVAETPAAPTTEPVTQVETPSVVPAVDAITKAPARAIDSVASATPVVEEKTIVEPEATVQSNSATYTIVLPLYVGMSEVKTGNDPHRVIVTENNNALKLINK